MNARTVARLALTAGLGLVGLTLVPSRSDACSIVGPISVDRMLRGADVIVRAVARDYVTPATPGVLAPAPGTVRFEVRETLKWSIGTQPLVLPGVLTDRDDFNDQVPPYTFVRPAGRRGNCVATDYRTGAEFLLFLERTATGYRVFREPLGPVNEQLHAPDDEWIRWVKAALATTIER